MRSTTYISNFALAAALAGGSAQAQVSSNTSSPAGSGLEEIVVTAQRRSENIQNVPISVQAFSAETLARAKVATIQDLTKVTSGFVGPGDNSIGSPHVRGIGSQISQPGIENSVATYVDGIYIGAISPALFELNGVKQIEVLKGPQGTLFGRNTTGGLVQIMTRDPGADFALEANAGYANYQSVSGWLYLNAPLGSAVSTNLSVQGRGQGKGWGTNLATGNDTYKVTSSLSVRNKWNFKLSDSASLLLAGDYERRNDVGFFALRSLEGSTNALGYTGRLDGWDVNNFRDERNRTRAWGLSAKFKLDLDFATLTNTTAYRRTRYNQLDQDATLSPIPFVYLDRKTRNKQWTEELQLASNREGPLTWVGGFFYYHASDDTLGPQTFPQPGLLPPPLTGLNSQTVDDTITSESYAGYVQASYRPFADTTITAGFRQSWDKHSIVGGTRFVFMGVPLPGAALGSPDVDTSFKTSKSAVRVSVQQKLSPASMIYASFNRGTKPGGYSPSSPNDAAFRDETLNAYEIGTKNTFLGGKARINLSAFYYDYKDIQESGFDVGRTFIINGGAAELYGADLDVELRPLDGLTIRSSLALLHSKFTDFPNALIVTPIPGGGYAFSSGSATGNSLPFSPKVSGSVGVDYTLDTGPGVLDFSVTDTFNSGYWADPSHTAGVRQNSYNQIGASVRFTTADDRKYVEVWGANLTSAKVYSVLGVTSISTFGGLNAPATYGVTIGFKM